MRFPAKTRREFRSRHLGRRRREECLRGEFGGTADRARDNDKEQDERAGYAKDHPQLVRHRLEFLSPQDAMDSLAGKPVYLGLAMSRDRTLVVKPQNLLMNLPLQRD